MVDRIGSQGGSLAHEAILAAARKQAEAASATHDAARIGGGADAAQTERGRFVAALEQGLDAVGGQVARAESLPEDVVTGRVDDFHELAARIKQADLSFKYALEVRNKLLDAYREVMRMNV